MNVHQKLTDQQVSRIRRSRDSAIAEARAHDVTEGYIRLIRKGHVRNGCSERRYYSRRRKLGEPARSVVCKCGEPIDAETDGNGNVFYFCPRGHEQ